MPSRIVGPWCDGTPWDEAPYYDWDDSRLPDWDELEPEATA